MNLIMIPSFSGGEARLKVFVGETQTGAIVMTEGKSEYIHQQGGTLELSLSMPMELVEKKIVEFISMGK
ncbi:TPA: hypothetical protein I7730_15940 [Vibrio vulnificus]|uniref:Uncharacterized protein n=1 Tax=Vibrio vulnificus TaxID=672 RepID=A0A8H9N1T8_VIBVL|nr:hypothetical protein [Vibrio vulnificus]